MPTETRSVAKGFLLTIYDADRRELARFEMPLLIAAPMGNRLLREVLPGRPVHEPSYTLLARYDRDFVRSQVPAGPTSLAGQRYDPDADPGPRVRLHPDAPIRSYEVCLLDFQTELFRGEFGVDDLFLHAATHVLRQSIQKGLLPGGGTYYYTVAPSRRSVRDLSPGLLPDEAYRADGVFRLPPPARGEPGILFKPVAQAPFPERDPAAFGPSQAHGKGTSPAGRVYLPARLFAELRQHMAFSPQYEEGGYLLGNVFRQPGSAEREGDAGFRWLVECTDLLRAEGTVGTPDRLLFTGDAWSKLTRRRDKDFAGRKLVGWYHTHLFAATDSFGLSGLDVNMHSWYLPKPWQFALLVNLEPGGGRVVRCYQYDANGDLAEAPFEVFG